MKPSRLFTSEIEYNFVSNRSQQLQETRLSFDTSTNQTNNRLLFRLPVIPGCQNDDASSRSRSSTEYTCSGAGMGDYLPVSTKACHKSNRHNMCLYLYQKHYLLKLHLCGSAALNVSQPHCGYWKIVEGECVLESVHLQRVEGTPCQSGGCSHTEGSESLRSGSCIIE